MLKRSPVRAVRVESASHEPAVWQEKRGFDENFGTGETSLQRAEPSVGERKPPPGRPVTSATRNQALRVGKLTSPTGNGSYG